MNITELFKRMGQRFFALRVYDLSAQMAYYFLLSIFPFLLVIYTLLAYVPVRHHPILELAKPYAPAATYHLIDKTLHYTVSTQRGNILSFSLIIMLWLSSMGFQSFKRIVNDAYYIKKRENMLKRIFEGLLLTIGFMVAIALSIFLPVVQRIMHRYFNEIFANQSFHSLWIAVQWGMGSLFLLFFFTMVYYFTPNVSVRLRQVMPGALFSMIGWQAVSLGFAAYVKLNNYAALYGQLGGIVVLMIWFYMSAMVLIIGALLNSELHPLQE
ncbi:Ribonuclease BN [Fictibacillus macauensis ZFHKF-1]|uniref:Ribonuclease BN n=1 Tax=Fictibacillus macauensis ZFHKF-1 TaxID=1196324 RepID=I8AF40_9BACL|nr:YihY/virulence factor BrkB family protein [Fictibacillus macauensis]EIT83954.1 Ribonuclease BN [Fictibacillus macauensis ZFHKF-1]